MTCSLSSSLLLSNEGSPSYKIVMSSLLVAVMKSNTRGYTIVHGFYFFKQFPIGWGDEEGAPIHMPMIRLETVEDHQMYCLMLSVSFIVKKSGTQAGIEPTTFGVPTHCSNH